MEADVARLFLHSHGIQALLFDAGMHSVLGAGALLPVRLMALAEDAEDALALLTEDGQLPPG